MLPRFVADRDLRARFRLEATITAEIDSEHIVETLDADVDRETGSPFVVMDLLKGEDLGATLERRGALPAPEVILLLRQTARALDRTHAAGVVHRDLKPANLFLTRGDDGEPKIKVLDFGIAKIVADSGTPIQTTCTMGTPFYMPPEQIRGEGSIGPRADLYALGHLAFTLLTGEPYWKEDRAAASGLFALFSRILAGAGEAPTTRAMRRCAVELPPAFDAWFAKATALDPEDRFDTASVEIAALADALHEAPRAGEAQAGRDVAARPPPAARRPSIRWLAALAILAGGATAAAVGLSFWPAAPSAALAGGDPQTSASAVALEPTSRLPPPEVAPDGEPSASPVVRSTPPAATPARAARPSPPPARPVATPRRGYNPTDVR